MKLNEIHMRDPFILPYEGVYYLYGTRSFHNTGFNVHTSTDLENWSEAHSVFEAQPGFWGINDFWAPEVHVYKGKFYMFASFINPHVHRGTAILVADSPMGPFRPHSDGAVTPRDWECLDGTFHLDEDGQPWMVFCHEWVQINDGTVCAIKLSDDLHHAISEPIELWKASAAPAVRHLAWKEDAYVTDGPFIFRHDGKLMSLWASFDETGYIEVMACSDNGRIDGNWSVDFPALLTGCDSGHGMLFTTFEGERKFTCHHPNQDPNERPVIYSVDGLTFTKD